jgi:hypothetical protein
LYLEHFDSIVLQENERLKKEAEEKLKYYQGVVASCNDVDFTKPVNLISNLFIDGKIKALTTSLKGKEDFLQDLKKGSEGHKKTLKEIKLLKEEIEFYNSIPC